jgi:hypothetical protein
VIAVDPLDEQNLDTLRGLVRRSKERGGPER